MKRALIKDTLFYKYMKELLNAEVLEKEHGFAIYTINGEECFIEHIYVDPRCRESQYASKLADEVCESAKPNATYLTGIVDQDSETKEKSIAVLEGYGMHYVRENEEFIYFRKDI